MYTFSTFTKLSVTVPILSFLMMYLYIKKNKCLHVKNYRGKTNISETCSKSLTFFSKI